jgi:hypothetical protein
MAKRATPQTELHIQEMASTVATDTHRRLHNRCNRGLIHRSMGSPSCLPPFSGLLLPESIVEVESALLGADALLKLAEAVRL